MTTTAFEDAAARVAAGAGHRAEAAALVAAMTTEERLGCLDGDTPFWPGLVDMTSGGYHRHTWPAAKVERLGIPGIEFSDGPRGCVVGKATCFPVSMARGATFDPGLEERIGEAIGAELRAAGATYTGAVCMNLLRHPAWGRAQETYGEDPDHVGEMASALTTGLQRHVMACMKHFALNSMENARFTVDVTADERALHEVYLPHFRRVAAAGVASVMSAYNSVNGEWCGENRTLLIDILREEWGWDGFVTSDFIFGLHDAVKSVGAGLSIEMPFQQQRAQELSAGLSDGSLRQADVDARVEDIVATLLRFAYVFDHQPSSDMTGCSDHRALARVAASASMVLLHNNGLLPLSPTIGSVAILGRLAAVPNLGDGGSSDVYPPSVVTPLDGIRSALPNADLRHSETDASIAASADVAVVVVGYTKADEGEYIDNAGTGALMHLFPPMDHPALGLPPRPASAKVQSDADNASGSFDTFTPGGDRASLRLSVADEALIAACVSANPRTVVLVMSGSAVVMPWLESTAATLMIWYPGMEGGHAIADVLLGLVEPGGRLPFAMPRDESHLVHFDRDATEETYGLLHGQWKLDHDGVAAHRPFGFGLGYSTFALRGSTSNAETVTVEVTNTGARAGSTVIQVFASVPGSAYERAPQRLVGFARVSLDAGETGTVLVPLRLSALRVRAGHVWITEDRPVTLEVGQHAHDDAAVISLRA